MKQEHISVTIFENKHPDLLNRIPKLSVEKRIEERIMGVYRVTGVAAAQGDTIVTEVEGEPVTARVLHRELRAFEEQEHCIFIVVTEQL